MTGCEALTPDQTIRHNSRIPISAALLSGQQRPPEPPRRTGNNVGSVWEPTQFGGSRLAPMLMEP
eukprot:4471283-Alexandrium_andersonii.AAC.1